MGKSFILKDQSGTVVGYFQQGIHTARCRLSGAEEGMEIILFYAGGKQKSRMIEAAGKEMEWEEAGGVIDSVVIVKDGVVLADSGVMARTRFESMLPKAQVIEKENYSEVLPASKTHGPKKADVSEEREAEGEKLIQKNRIAERRWPRPPCWQEAVYRHGMWMDRQ